MSYDLAFTENALKDIEKLRKTGDKKLLQKLVVLYVELREHPRTGTGHIEQLKHFKEETWSRRINREHRIIYRICDEIVEVLVLSAHGHYGDK